MPKFVEVVSDEDDDEVLIVPYVKPPPPVIDLMESSSDGDGEDQDQPISSSPSKAKRKKKKRSKTPQPDNQNQGDGEVEDASTPIILSDQSQNQNHALNAVVTDCDINAAQVPPTSISTPGRARAPQHLNADRINELNHSSGNVSLHPDAIAVLTNGTDGNLHDGLTMNRTDTETAQSRQGQGQSSRNAAVKSTLVNGHGDNSTIESEERETLPSIRIASSIFESCNGAVDESESPGPGSAANVAVATIAVGQSPITAGGSGGGQDRQNGVGGTPKTPILTLDGSGPGKKGSHSKPKRANANALPNGRKSPTKPPKTRERVSTKKQTATERTNVAISNFLTTLGIYEPSEGPLPLSAPRKIRKSRVKNPQEQEDQEQVIPNGMLPPPPSVFDEPILTRPRTSVAKATATSRAPATATATTPIPSSTEPITPVNVNVSTPSTSTPTHAGSSSSGTPVPVPFVSVTETETPCSRPRSRSPKKRKRPTEDGQSASGLIEDITFTDKELEETVTVNIRTNILIGGTLNLDDDGEAGNNARDNSTPDGSSGSGAGNTSKRARIESEIERDIQAQIQSSATIADQGENDNFENSNQTLKETGKTATFVAICLNCAAMSKDLQKCLGCGTVFPDDVAIISEECGVEYFNVEKTPVAQNSTTPSSGKSGSKSKSSRRNASHMKSPKSIVLAKPFNTNSSEDNAPLVPVITIENNRYHKVAEGSCMDIENDEDLDLATWQPPSHLPAGWNPAMVKFYDCSKDPDFRLTNVYETMSDDPSLWETREQELPGRSRPNKKFRCANCSQFGHLARQCTEKRKDRMCALCGGIGHLANGKGRPCPNLLCLRCGERRSRLSHGCHSCSNLPRCGNCNAPGHREESCPDQWRRFFSTISADEGSCGNDPLYFGEKPEYRLHRDSYCANCGQKSHNYYHCRVPSRSSYAPNQPRIVEELPLPSPRSRLSQPRGILTARTNHNHHSFATSTVTSESQAAAIAIARASMGNLIASDNASSPIVTDSPSKRTVVFDSATGNKDDDDTSMTIKVVNETILAPASRTPISAVNKTYPNPNATTPPPKPAGSESGPSKRVARVPSTQRSLPAGRRCLDYPDCQNKPLMGTTCHNMYVVPSEHKLILEAQKANQIQSFAKKHNVEITVLYNQSAIHIAGKNFHKAKDDLTEFLRFLKNYSTPQIPPTASAKPKTEAVASSSSSKDKSAVPVPSTSPEIITLDSEEDNTNINNSNTPQQQQQQNRNQKPLELQVALLESEWDLIYSQVLKQRSGLIDILVKQFNCDITVSKDPLSVKIIKGSLRNMKLAQKNIIYWLECQAANVDWTMQLSLDTDHPQYNHNQNQRQQQQGQGRGNKKRKNNNPIQGNNPKKRKKNKNNKKNKNGNPNRGPGNNNQYQYQPLVGVVTLGAGTGNKNSEPQPSISTSSSSASVTVRDRNSNRDDRDQNQNLANNRQQSESASNSSSSGSGGHSHSSKERVERNPDRDRQGRGDWDRNYRGDYDSPREYGHNNRGDVGMEGSGSGGGNGGRQRYFNPDWVQNQQIPVPATGLFSDFNAPNPLFQHGSRPTNYDDRSGSVRRNRADDRHRDRDRGRGCGSRNNHGRERDRDRNRSRGGDSGSGSSRNQDIQNQNQNSSVDGVDPNSRLRYYYNPGD